MLTILVTFKLQAEHRAAFRDAVLANAHESLATETGCHVFDVSEHPECAEFLLYEIYDDAAAFDVHLAAPHFAAFSKLTAPWVESKQVVRYERIER